MCGNAVSGLADDIYKINAQVDPSLLGVANGIRAICGETNDGSEKKEEKDINIVELCKEGKGNILEASKIKPIKGKVEGEEVKGRQEDVR